MPGSRSRPVAALLAVGLVLAVAGQLWLAEARSDVEHAVALDKLGRPVTAQQAAGDWDGDGIPDDRDACPTRPETVNGFQDTDGCPDVVTRTRAS